MKTMKLMIGMVLLAASLGAQTNVATNVAWKIVEKYDRKCDGWVKGSMLKGGSVGIEKVSGNMRAPSALRVRMINNDGEMEAKKIFNIPAIAQGKEIVVEAMLGYNFKTETGRASEFCTVTAYNKRGETLYTKEIKRDEDGGTLQGTLTDMEVNRFAISSNETANISSIQISLRVKAHYWDAMIAEVKRGKTCMSELWLRSITIGN